MQEYSGTIQFLDIEGGVWVLTLPSGEHYALFRAPKELLQEGLEVTIQGQIREDMVTVAQVGPVLEVKSFQRSPSLACGSGHTNRGSPSGDPCFSMSECFYSRFKQD
jgi:hypothetical protein